mmetsp:Transcript_20827/g.58712  ORF Transcript_20827/g.58712 Transcript_20827/m.58712 type:complete len:402 (+) Transcript_20827:117-1322(+)
MAVGLAHASRTLPRRLPKLFLRDGRTGEKSSDTSEASREASRAARSSQAERSSARLPSAAAPGPWIAQAMASASSHSAAMASSCARRPAAAARTEGTSGGGPSRSALTSRRAALTHSPATFSAARAWRSWWKFVPWLPSQPRLRRRLQASALRAAERRGLRPWLPTRPFSDWARLSGFAQEAIMGSSASTANSRTAAVAVASTAALAASLASVPGAGGGYPAKCSSTSTDRGASGARASQPPRPEEVPRRSTPPRPLARPAGPPPRRSWSTQASERRPRRRESRSRASWPRPWAASESGGLLASPADEDCKRESRSLAEARSFACPLAASSTPHGRGTPSGGVQASTSLSASAACAASSAPAAAAPAPSRCFPQRPPPRQSRQSASRPWDARQSVRAPTAS